MSAQRALAVPMRHAAVSFQIRMPFVKGMLHQVDFHRFFNEYFPGKGYCIRDIFGIPRRIDDVQLILTKSMFKCADWLKDYCALHPETEDPMEWFFSMFHRYGHALYICNTDANMGCRKVSMNYQFLSTLAMTPEVLDKLIKRHLNEAHSIPRTGAKYAVDISEYAEDGDKAAGVPAWRYALDMNPDFVKDPFISGRLKMDETARVKDVCSGRIVVDGVLKYLSGDLLGLLIHLIYNKKVETEDGFGDENGLGVLTEDGFRIDSERNLAVANQLKKQLIRSGRFYTGDAARLKLRTDQRYSISHI